MVATMSFPDLSSFLKEKSLRLSSFFWPDNSDGLRIVSRSIRDAESSQKCCISWNINLYTAKHKKEFVACALME